MFFRGLLIAFPATLYAFSEAKGSTADSCERALPAVFRVLVSQGGKQVGIGSGFFIRPDGTALTAYHVLKPGAELEARLDNGEVMRITSTLGHAKTDIALLKVKVPGPVPFITLGDSDMLRRGEQVIHIGNSIYSETSDIEVGYINKLRDDTPAWLKAYTKGDLAPKDSGLTFIRTTGAPKPGFSGGPLLNLAGEAVGLISRLFVKMDQFGMQQEGACIPSNFIKTIIDQLEGKGSVARPYLGFSFTDTNSGLAVLKVQKGSPAERSGIQVGDILTEANSIKLATPEDLYQVIGYKSGYLNLKVKREGKAMDSRIDF
jgi:serine protease Do